MLKTKLIHQFFLKDSRFKNPVIELAESILAYNSRTKIFPYMGITQTKKNNINFHLTQNREKSNDKTFSISQKP